jgi:murein L,D-transpeptidase YafK
MKKTSFVLLFFLQFSVFAQTFRQEQKQFPRVREAYEEKWDSLKELIKNKGFEADKFKIFIRVFKDEGVLEAWISKSSEEKFILLKTYQIAASSGDLGPKRKQGDLQVPEGFYRIAVFNPSSNYHLSLGINYPNQSDKIIGREKLGGDIYIHGSDVTIGCVPITDDKIKELYILATEARSIGQKNIYVHIFPFKLDEKILNLYKNNDNYAFWKDLQKGYLFFNQNKKLPFVQIDKAGKYVIAEK